MQKKLTHIFFIFLAVLLVSACNGEKKIHESETTKSKKVKKDKLVLGKYNKLLKTGSADAKYDAAIVYYENEDYVKAITLFEELMTVYRGTEKSELVHYYYANCTYYTGDYILAGYQFRTFVKNFSKSKHVEFCAYMNAYCFYLNSPEYTLEQIDTYLAIKEFHKFTIKYPNSDKIIECNRILDELREKLEHKSYDSSMLYYNLTNYKSAVVAFENHMIDFPGSKHLEEFKFLTIKSYYLLAINSIESKKEERYKSSINAYLKFVDLFPTSKYIKEAESIYSNSLKNIEKV